MADDRQALEDQTATDICTACTTYDMTGLIADLQGILSMAVPDSKYAQSISSTIGVAQLLNNVSMPTPAPTPPEDPGV